MTYKQHSSTTQQQIVSHLWVVILNIVIIGLFNHQAIYAADNTSGEDGNRKPEEKNNTLLISTEQPGLSAEKDFDKIRNYESYDPITNTWSAIESFKEVEIFEDTTQHHDENYVYYSFWAYDSLAHQWKRVDIREYGYKNAQLSANSEEAIIKKPKKKFEFWKNLGLTFAVGGGSTYYVNTTNNLNLIVKKGQKEYFLQTPGSSDAAQGKGYKIRWFSHRLSKIHSLKHDNVVNSRQSYDEVQGDISFHGIGFNIPLTLALHYTFFKKLRIGAGSNLEINYLRQLYPQGDAKRIPAYETADPWFYNSKLFGTIGYKFFQKGKHAVVVDTQLGAVWDYGEKWDPTGQFINVSFYGSLGTAHEIKLNDFCKFFYRLSGQFKQYYNASDFASVGDDKPSTSSITLWQPAIHLEIGTIFNFGRNKEEEDAEDEDTNVVTADQLAGPQEGNMGVGTAVAVADADQVKSPAVNEDNSSGEAYAAQPSQVAPQEQPANQQQGISPEAANL